MKHQFTITINTPDLLVAERVRDRAAGAIEDFVESSRPGFDIDCGALSTVGADNDQAAIVAARAEREEEGEIEIDDNAKVSYSTDGGAYVQAWVWVGDDAIIGAGGTNPETGAGMPDEGEAALAVVRVETVDSEGGHCD
jgi:hypothetical protein